MVFFKCYNRKNKVFVQKGKIVKVMMRNAYFSKNLQFETN